MANEELTKEAAIEYLKWIRPQKPWSLDKINVQKALDMAIEALQEERSQGEWEYVQYDANPKIGNWHCSNCRCIPFSIDIEHQKTNFCPNCGARMLRGDQK